MEDSTAERKPAGQRLLDFIEHPLFLWPAGLLGGLVGLTIFTPLLVICGACILLAFHRAGVVRGEPLKKQIVRYGAVICITTAILWGARRLMVANLPHIPTAAEIADAVRRQLPPPPPTTIIREIRTPAPAVPLTKGEVISISDVPKNILVVRLHSEALDMRTIYEDYWNIQDNSLFNEEQNARNSSRSDDAEKWHTARSQLRSLFELQISSILKEEEVIRAEAVKRLGATQEDRDQGAELSGALKANYNGYQPDTVKAYSSYLDRLAARLSQ